MEAVTIFQLKEMISNTCDVLPLALAHLAPPFPLHREHWKNDNI